MKKIILIKSFVLFLVCSVSYAQFGVKVGANMSKVGQTGSGTGYTLNSNLLIGGQGGIYYTKNFSDKLGLSIEALYIMKGEKVTNSNIERRSYFSIPVLLQYHLSNKFSIVPGLSFNYALFDKFRGLAPNKTGFDGIIGLKVKTSSKSSIEFRYDHGLTSVEKTQAIDRKQIQTRSLQLFVNFDLSKK